MVKISGEQSTMRPEEIQYWGQKALQAFLVLMFVVVGALIISADALLPARSKLTLIEGEVAPRDVLAPRSLQYESEVLSKAKRDAAVAAVRPIFDPPDAGVASDQLQLTRNILDFIENVRFDDFATIEEKTADVSAITELELEANVTRSLLQIEDENTWRSIDAQVTRLLQRVMSGEVRQDNIQAVRDNLPNLVSASFSDTDVRIITGIVSDLVRVNTFFNEELTRQAELDAAQNISVEIRSFARGQMIIREGEISNEAHIEALERFGLLRVTTRKTEQFLAGLLIMSMAVALLVTYIRKFYTDLLEDTAFMAWLAVLFLVFIGGTQLLDAENSVQPYYYPASALALLLTTLVSSQLAIVVTVVLAVVAGFTTGNSLQFAVLISLGGTMSVLSLGRTERLNAYFFAGVVVWIVTTGVAFFFALGADAPPTTYTLAMQMAGAAANGLLSAAVALVGLYFVSSLLNLPTSLKILELSQPNHPLLQRLLREAPGTYQHSLQVANLAELGAQQISANASLVRVASMYHDIGKILNPHFFVENQATHVNPHDALGDPVASARIIIGHVTEGNRLARRYRLPHRLRDFILEHHGTTQVLYFFRKAQEAEVQGGKPVQLADFSYPGPRPQSRETAILMLADGCESSVRARRPQTKEEIQETVDYIFELRLQTGELDDSDLTLNDLRLLRDSFLTVLQGVFHPRIAYPGTPTQEKATLPEAVPSQLVAGETVEKVTGNLAAAVQLDAAAAVSESLEEAVPADSSEQVAGPKKTAQNDSVEPDTDAANDKE